MYIFRIILSIIALAFAPLAIAQDNPVAGMILEVTEAEEILDARYERRAAHARLTQEFTSVGIQYSLRHITAWGDWLWLHYWRKTQQLYLNTGDRLNAWRRAVQNGSISAEFANTTLQPSMAAFRNINQQVPAWMESEVRNYVEHAGWMDLAHVAPPGLHNYALESANQALQDPFRPNFDLFKSMVLVPTVPQPGQPSQDIQRYATDQLISRISTFGQNPIHMRALLAEARMHMMIYPSSQTAQLDVLLRVLDERMALQERSVPGILAAAEALPSGALREHLLSDAHDALLEQAAHLAPLLASNAEDESSMQALSGLLDSAKRMVSLRDDLKNPLSSTSGLLRFVSALSASATILDAQERGTFQAREITSIVNDFGTTFGPTVPVTAPFAAPLGAVTGLLNRVAEAAKASSVALNGVSSAIKGDPSGMSRTRAAAASVRTLLDPRLIVKDMADGAFEGIISNVPFARSLINMIID